MPASDFEKTIETVERKRHIEVSPAFEREFAYTRHDDPGLPGLPGLPSGSYLIGTRGPGVRFSCMFGIHTERRRHTRVIDEATAYADSHAVVDRLERRREAHSEPRRRYIDAHVNRNGFDPITGQGKTVVGLPSERLDTFKPRVKAQTADKGTYLAWEAKKRMADELRFFNVPDPDSSSLQARARIVACQGLEDLASRRYSGVIGYGRKELPSFGAADSFSAADYGGTRWASPDKSWNESTVARLRLEEGHPDEKLEIQRTFQGVVPKDAWDVGVYAHDVEAQRRRLAATARAPNRIFDVTTAAVHLRTTPDPRVRIRREEAELAATRPPRPADRPASFTANATMAASRKVYNTKAAEVDMVARLAL